MPEITCEICNRYLGFDEGWHNICKTCRDKAKEASIYNPSYIICSQVNNCSQGEELCGTQVGYNNCQHRLPHIDQAGCLLSPKCISVDKLPLPDFIDKDEFKL